MTVVDTRSRIDPAADTDEVTQEPEEGGTSAPETDMVAMRLVLDWVASPEELTERIAAVPGATDAQRAYLTRLSAIILSFIDSSTAPESLLAALQPASSIVVPGPVRTAVGSLLDSDAVASLAAIYARTVAAANRRALGTFFTPRPEAESMVEEYSRKHGEPQCVVDVGAGVGVFSEAAGRQWPNAAIYAVDINPVTLGLQALARLGNGSGHVELCLADYALWLAKFRPSGPTLYLGNPPYTRWQLIPQGRREALVDASGSLVRSRANLSTLFLAMTLERLRGEDGLCLIVPAAWMSAQYARGLRAHVREQHRRPVTLRLADSWRFDSAIVDAVVVQIGPESKEPQPLVVTDWPGATTVLEVRERDDGGGPFAGLRADRPVGASAAEDGVRLRDVAAVTRGTATGANRFFLLDKVRVQALGIPDRWLIPVIRRLRPGVTPEAPNAEFSSLLVLEGYGRGDDPHVESALTIAEQLGVHLGHLCAQRPHWFDLSREVQRPSVAISALSKGRFHVYENMARCGITNNLFGLTWRAGVDPATRSVIVSWLREPEGQLALEESSSIEADGLRRLSPRALGSLVVPTTRDAHRASSTVAPQIGGRE